MRLLASTVGSRPIHAANRHGLDYDAEAVFLPPPAAGIFDVHTHVNGPAAAALYARVARRYGVIETWSMTRLEECDAVRDALDGRVRYIAVPDYWQTTNRAYHMGPGFLPRIERYRERGAILCKFWAAPRARDLVESDGVDPAALRLDAPGRIEAMTLASSLGMGLMVHVADPDTWFRTKYADASRYGTKRGQYEPFERVLDRFPGPWLAAHMGGWPEDLAFLDDLLARHPSLHLDTSATKWMVRELSRHGRDELLDFLRRHRGRILFGSDIVTMDEHLRQDGAANEMQAKAGGPDEAYDLYASRYWALRTLMESDWSGTSPIADPDLAMVAPDRHGPDDAPPLVGKRLPDDVLRDVYHDAPRAFLDRIESSAPSTADRSGARGQA